MKDKKPRVTSWKKCEDDAVLAANEGGLKNLYRVNAIKKHRKSHWLKVFHEEIQRDLFTN